MPYDAVVATPLGSRRSPRDSLRTARRAEIVAAGVLLGVALVRLLGPAAVAAVSWLGRVLLAVLPAGAVDPAAFF